MTIILDRARELYNSSTVLNAVDKWQKPTNGNGYSVGDIVEYNEEIFYSVKDSNKDAPTVATSWIYWNTERQEEFPIPYPSNKFRLFDDYLKTYTYIKDGDKYVFNTEYSDYIGFYNVSMEKIHIKMMEKGSNTVLYEETIDVTNNTLWDTWDWIYWTGEKEKKRIFREFPPNYNAYIEVEFIGDGAIGALELGQKKVIGCTVARASFSYKTEKKAKIENNIVYYGKKKVGGFVSISATVKNKTVAEYNESLAILESIADRITTFIVDDTIPLEDSIEVFTRRGIISEVRGQSSSYQYDIIIDCI